MALPWTNLDTPKYLPSSVSESVGRRGENVRSLFRQFRLLEFLVVKYHRKIMVPDKKLINCPKILIEKQKTQNNQNNLKQRQFSIKNILQTNQENIARHN
jgi:hypothetical protein